MANIFSRIGILRIFETGHLSSKIENIFSGEAGTKITLSGWQYGYVTDDGSYSSGGTGCTSDYVQISSGYTYTIVYPSTITEVRFAIYDSNQNFVSRIIDGTSVYDATADGYLRITAVDSSGSISTDSFSDVYLSAEVTNISGGLSITAAKLLVTILRNGVYATDQSTNIADLENALCNSGNSEETEKTLTGISATYSGGDVTVGTDVTSLTGITVIAEYSDGSTETVTDYTLTGTIAEGDNAITVSYGDITTTINVTGVAESGSGDSVSVDIQSLLTAKGYYYDGYPDVLCSNSHNGTSLDGGTTPAYAIELIAGAVYTLKTAHNNDETGTYGPAAFSGAADGSVGGAWRGNINKITSVEKMSDEIDSGVYLLTYTFTVPEGATTYLCVGCLNNYVGYASLSYQSE